MDKRKLHRVSRAHSRPLGVMTLRWPFLLRRWLRRTRPADGLSLRLTRSSPRRTTKLASGSNIVVCVRGLECRYFGKVRSRGMGEARVPEPGPGRYAGNLDLMREVAASCERKASRQSVMFDFPEKRLTN